MGLLFQVTIEDFRRNLPRCPRGFVRNAKYEDAEVRVPLRTTIYQMKAMGLLKYDKESFRADGFTLEHEGVELGDECTLGSIYSPGSEELRFKVHSISCTVRDWDGIWEFPLKMKRRDLEKRAEDFVKEQVHLEKGIHPHKVRGINDGICCETFPCGYSSFPGNFIHVRL